MAGVQNAITAKDPNDYTYVSIKNWNRKQKILAGNDKLANIIGRPGPITGFILGIVDVIMTLVIKLGVNMFTICKYAFDWLYNMLFGLFNGIIPSSIVGGTVISMKYFRYMITVLMPPFGILVSKGLYGWFSIIVCILITYVNFMAGIIYALVITARNRYADQYEAYELTIALGDSNNESLQKTFSDTSALLGTCGFVILFISVMFFFLSFC